MQWRASSLRTTARRRRLEHIGAAASAPYGCSLRPLRLQPPPPTVAGAPLLPLFWGGGLLCALSVPVLVALVCAFSPAASQVSPRSEVYVARALIIVDLTTAALSAVCLGITIGTRAFHRIPTPHT